MDDRMTAQKLRNSILQMAVQGKLVPQDPNDEPASVLLERIRKEKEQLIKEGKIKKIRKSPVYSVVLIIYIMSRLVKRLDALKMRFRLKFRNHGNGYVSQVLFIIMARRNRRKTFVI